MKDIKNKIILLHLLCEAELEELSRRTEQEELSLLAGQALERYRHAPGEQGESEKKKDPLPWYSFWQAVRREDEKTMAYFCFRGPQRHGTLELDGLLTRAGENSLLQEKKYDLCHQALTMLLHWAFSRDTNYFIRNRCRGEEDTLWRTLLRRCEFRCLNGKGSRQRDWELERPASTWLSVFICIGLSIGLSIGLLLFQSVFLGSCLGLVLGLGTGLGLDLSDKKLRQRLREARQAEKAEIGPGEQLPQ
ncbi:MAG: hypothetical protein Q4B50_02405 [Bacillota bacterium]|nr:hypothetical protein [Bacillota bacterium]